MTAIGRPFRLAILGTRGIPAKYGGFETFAEEIATRLVSAGIDVTVYCERVDTAIEPDELRGVRLVYVSSPKLGPLSTVLFDTACLWHARRTFDVVYMLGYGSSPFCAIPRLFNTRIWINMDGIEWARSKWSSVGRAWLRLCESVALRTADHIIADAGAVATSLSRRHRRRYACSVIPYGAQIVRDAATEPLAEWDLASGAYCLVVCRLEPENHVKEIVAGYVASNYLEPIVVVGDASLRTNYVRSLRALNDPRVRFIGVLYDPEKLRALRFHSKVYFHGHSVGGTNPSLLEALGCGNIVIAHDNEFNREVAGDAATYFAEPSDIPRCLSDLESSPITRQVMRSAAQKRASERYSWEYVTSQYLNLIERTPSAL